MEGVRFKLITGNDPDIFQERLNRFVQDLPENVVLVEVKFSVAEGPSPLFAALLQYKEVEAWRE
ncbi:MAG: hypothetical protein NZ846_07785 [Thermus sp.]|uniref:hypothetical protein n=1 Tax=unclassified Thermus TaxID=2619321 RepID=UPI0002F184CF|nr:MULTISPECIES: hypothetical protein [unclassified Thermus]MCS6867952.1 hypothetical protein [Thermus sp.]MCS7218861.1 hypothetical protein [Thermus sp.]MCX7850677.1 hypothetical protein [Thermus sp.]MDW8017630.1 hypothetical protein [Thermus sp.]MDW8356657.1 hypothetical protein [Thermus sp.]